MSSTPPTTSASVPTTAQATTPLIPKNRPQTQPHEAPERPSLPWRTASSLIMGMTGGICRTLLFALNSTETVGLNKFQAYLAGRKDPATRERGLITTVAFCIERVLTVVKRVDDPLVWGVLNYGQGFDPNNMRWTLGSADLCFTNKFISTFFSMGQVLPTHRSRHSKFGGPFQPTIAQSIRLLSAQPFYSNDPMGLTTSPAPEPSRSAASPEISDPFSSTSLTYTTTGSDTIPAPSAYSSRRHAWVHIFPEGYIHQHPQKIMRYFRWGVSRLILESEPMPDIVPIWIDGSQDIMHESRKFPRFLPRVGRNVRIAFGDLVDTEAVFGPARRKWKQMVAEQQKKTAQGGELAMGELNEVLQYGKEAVELRMEVTRLVRDEVMKVRKRLGYPDEDPKNGHWETWKFEGVQGDEEGRQEDGSWVKPA